MNTHGTGRDGELDVRWILQSAFPCVEAIDSYDDLRGSLQVRATCVQIISLHVLLSSGGTNESMTVAPFGQIMHGFSGIVRQQIYASISYRPHLSDPITYFLLHSMSSEHVIKSPLSAYGVKSSSSVAPSGQMMQGSTSLVP